ncbi:MAG: DUF3034 family protein [Acidiferrobacter sp.]
MKKASQSAFARSIRKALLGGGVAIAWGLGTIMMPLAAHAKSLFSQRDLFGQGRPPGTGGLTMISGAAGGGLVPWALIGGYGTGRQVGFSVFYTHAATADFNANGYGVLAGIGNRVEVSIAQQNFDLGNTGPALAAALGAPSAANPGGILQNNAAINQDIIGVKVRVFGNTIYQQHTWMPQVSVGAQYHHNEDDAFMDTLGTKSSGMSYYVALTKVWMDGLLGHATLLDFTLDATRANYNGLFGFQGPYAGDNSYHYEPEVSAGIFLNPHVVVGGEYRAMPQNELAVIGSAGSQTNAWKDVFVAYIPNKSVSLTFAYAMLGHIASIPNNNGLYTSLTVSF